MPSPHFATRLPTPIRLELNQRLRGCGYRNSTEISDWLTQAGYPIGQSSISVYGRRLRNADLAEPRRLSDATPETQAAFAAFAETLFQAWIGFQRVHAAISLTCPCPPDVRDSE